MPITDKVRAAQRIAATTHGEYVGGVESYEHAAWRGMLQRCYNPNHRAYKNYGGRGIRVCKRWHEFENFLEDMGRRPAPHLTLERTKNHLGYSKANCTWATRAAQQLNRRVTYLLEKDGDVRALAEWADALGISYNLALYRWKNWGTLVQGQVWLRQKIGARPE